MKAGLFRLEFRHHSSQTRDAGCHDAREDHDLVEEGGDADLEGLVAVGGFDGVQVGVESGQFGDDDSDDSAEGCQYRCAFGGIFEHGGGLG